MIATAQAECRGAYETVNSPEEVPLFELVHLRAPSGDHLTHYRVVDAVSGGFPTGSAGLG